MNESYILPEVTPGETIMTLENIQEVLDTAKAKEGEDISEQVSSVISEIGTELRSIFTHELLMSSLSWHVLAGSTLKDNTEPLNQKSEDKVRAVLTDLITRKLKPLLG